MRTVEHDTTTIFRINAALLAAAQDRVRRDGMSMSEFLRDAVRQKVKEAA